MFTLLLNSFFIGIGLAFGVIGAIGIIMFITKLTTILATTFVPNWLSKWEYGKHYNNYQAVVINGVEWVVQPCPISKTTILKRRQSDKYLVVSEYNNLNDINEGVDQMEVTRQPETHEVT